MKFYFCSPFFELPDRLMAGLLVLVQCMLVRIQLGQLSEKEL